jgi:hypothetical protein
MQPYTKALVVSQIVLLLLKKYASNMKKELRALPSGKVILSLYTQVCNSFEMTRNGITRH